MSETKKLELNQQLAKLRSDNQGLLSARKELVELVRRQNNSNVRLLSENLRLKEQNKNLKALAAYCSKLFCSPTALETFARAEGMYFGKKSPND